MPQPPILPMSLLLAGATALAAADTNKWEITAAAGLTLTRGNTKTLLGTANVDAKNKGPADEILLGAAGVYGENTVDIGKKTEKTQKTVNAISAYGQYNHSFSEDWYGGIRGDFLHDEIADVAYRFTISPLVGYYAIKRPMTTLKFEGGPSGVFERQGDQENQYAALRLGERFEHKFSPKARVWQSFDYMPQVDRFHNYLITFELGAEAALTEKLRLRGVFQDNYDNEPAPGRKRNDIRLITALAYKF